MMDCHNQMQNEKNTEGFEVDVGPNEWKLCMKYIISESRKMLREAEEMINDEKDAEKLREYERRLHLLPSAIETNMDYLKRVEKFENGAVFSLKNGWPIFRYVGVEKKRAMESDALVHSYS